jgi:hypothetical protein
MRNLDTTDAALGRMTAVHWSIREYDRRPAWIERADELRDERIASSRKVQ